MNKIVVFTGNLSYSVRKGIASILEQFPDIELLVIEHRPRKEFRQLFKNQYKNVEKHGWRWLVYIAKELTHHLTDKIFIQVSVRREAIGLQFEWSEISKNNKLSHIQTYNLHNEETHSRVRAFMPDLGVALAAPILRSSLFNIPAEGTINLHKGKLPYYRGMPPAFWEMWNLEKSVGCSIHVVEEGLDSGAIILEKSIAINEYSTVKGLQISLDELGVVLMCDALKLYASKRVELITQKSGGTINYKPTLKQEYQLKRRCNKLKLPFRRILKDVVFWVYLKVISPILRIILSAQGKQRISVVLYHRVNDQHRDSVTVGIEQFDRQMEILSKKYHVVSIENLVNNTFPRKTSKPVVAVTFDDGYLDNFENAVPILEKYGIPAGFFVSTGLIESKNGFRHDLEKLGYALPNMTWEHLEKMQAIGFTIGSHTVTHLNCAKGEIRLVRHELIESMEALNNNLKLCNIIFAYPFGGKEDINSKAMSIVKEVGYSGCLSAYGGYNYGEVDSYNVLRVGIDFNFSDLAFCSKIEGL